MSVEDNIKIREAVETLLSLVEHLHGNPRFYEQMRASLSDLETELLPMPDPIKEAAKIDPQRIGRRVIEFGKYGGQRIDEIPLDYLEWLSDQSRTLSRELDAYLNSKRVLAERIDHE